MPTQQLHLKNNFLDLTLLPEAGCHWKEWRIALKGEWLDLLFPVEDESSILTAPSSLGSYIMVPWSNRIPGGRFEFEGKTYVVRTNFPDGTAIHGDVRKRPWEVVKATPVHFEARLDSRSLKDWNYPFHLMCDHRIRLEGPSLHIQMTLKNVDKERAPVGMGYHPFFKRRLRPGHQEAELALPARKVYPAVACIPQGQAQAVSGKEDLREAKPLGTPDLDHGYTDFSEPGFRILYPEEGVEVRAEMDPVFAHAVVYIPNDDSGQGREFFAVEPVTHATNGFNLFNQGWEGTGVKVLEPGESWSGRWRLTLTGNGLGE